MTPVATQEAPSLRQRLRDIGTTVDPRWPFAFLLTLYCALGFSLFGFSRTPWQMLFICGSGAVLDALLHLVVKREWRLPLSAWISCCSLAILLNYSKHSAILFLPVLLAIGSKYVLTWGGRHFFNPSMFGVATSLLFGRELITAAPAYQWAGASVTVTFFLVTAAAALFIWRIGRGWLIASFLFFYAVNTGIRAVIMRHHLPPEMLFLGTMTTPPFYLFTLYMITDPQTSPKTPRAQVLLALALASVDLVLHLKESVFTLFYAALAVATARYLFVHAAGLVRLGPRGLLRQELTAERARGIGAVLVVALAYAGLAFELGPTRATARAPFAMERVDVKGAGLGTEMGDLLQQVDPRLQHIGKWILSVGDAVAVGDVDGDGRVDLFLSNPMKRADDRCALYGNRSDASGLRFARMPLPALDELAHEPKRFGVCAGGTFADLDGDGDLDLAVAVAFGQSRLLINDGTGGFTDESSARGLVDHTVSLGISLLDFDNDDDLDLFVLNATSPFLDQYDPPRPLNAFSLPAAEHDGDRRMFHFMHNGWHDADNGGGQTLYRNTGGGHFEKVDKAVVGLDAAPGKARWSLAASTADFNDDGFVDIYVANDFGPDELLLNDGGKRFVRVRGSMFNDVGNDTYKGMNASIADFDRNGSSDVYISNVHHALQAEGSILWMVSMDPKDPFVPVFVDEATRRGVLNEHRFAWGAQAGDLDDDGWPDLVQANGMVDDRLDHDDTIGPRKDYWYVNHKLMQSGPETHTYADMWGDLRGRTIFPNEARRAYLNTGGGVFVDVADELGIADPDDSRGVLLSDLDNDGDLDLLVTNQHGPASLYRSPLRGRIADRHWLDVELVGRGENTRAIGAVAIVEYDVEYGVEHGGDHGGVVSQRQEVGTLGGFSSQHDPRLHFGLGDVRGPVRVRVRWPGSVRDESVVQIDAVDRRVVVRAP